MALLDLQTAIGRLVRVSTGEDPFRGLNLDAAERTQLAELVDSAGFRITVAIQRSWCAGRAAKASKLTLSILPPGDRQRLLADWVNAGGGTTSFFAAEADAFLDFIARHLPDPSHALTLCRVEQATLRAREGSLCWTESNPSWLDTPACVLRAGRHATLVHFHAEPRLLLAALEGQPLPPLSSDTTPVLFGPGLDGFSRLATGDEVVLLERLVAPKALGVLLQEGLQRKTIETLSAAGIIENAG